MNSPFSETYQRILDQPIKVGVSPAALQKTFHHWVNDGLMVIFFLLVGLELKRELIVGALSDFRTALLPAIAALGGMVVRLSSTQLGTGMMPSLFRAGPFHRQRISHLRSVSSHSWDRVCL